MPEIIWKRDGINWICPLEDNYELWRSEDGHEIRLKYNGRSVTVDWCQSEFELEKRAEELAKDVRLRTKTLSQERGIDSI